jgi:hypothetical protein
VIKRHLERLACASGIGLASVAACAAAAPEAGARPASASAASARAPERVAPGPLASPDELARREGDKGDKGDRGDKGGASDAGAPRCPYGALEDPHRGFVRCLLPDERDAGWLPPPPQNEPPPPDPPRDAGASAPSGPLPSVEIGAPKFENGEVTKVEKSLGKASPDLARCVADHGGLSGDATVKIQFLVRSRGRAEGVEVASAKGVSGEAAACVRQVLKNRAIGAPTADPVGVTVTIAFKPGK